MLYGHLCAQQLAELSVTTHQQHLAKLQLNAGAVNAACCSRESHPMIRRCSGQVHMYLTATDICQLLKTANSALTLKLQPTLWQHSNAYIIIIIITFY